MSASSARSDPTAVGAFQVAANGDLANWATDDEHFPPVVGGGMDHAVVDVTPERLLVRELVDGLRPEGLQHLTGAELRFADDLGVPAATSA